jgi:very-short-patch-repair endonuclease
MLVAYSINMEIAVARARAFRKCMTDAETILRSRLRRNQMHGQKIRRQHPIGPYIADFACVSLRLVIELDGATHSSAEEISHDRKREAYLRHHGFRVLRFRNSAVYENLDAVLRRISSDLETEILRRKYG